MQRKNVCVFLSARPNTPDIEKRVYDFGAALAQNNFRLIFGGDSIPGLMRTISKGHYDHGSQSLAIQPTCFGWDCSPDFAEIEKVADMGERKNRMIVESDAFVVLLGGLGTLDELLEVWTRKVLGEYDKPIMLCVPNTYRQALEQIFKVMLAHHTVNKEDLDHLQWFDNEQDLMLALREQLR